ncbi:MAG: EAL domain-containing protein [Parvibaculaceae bacterium]|nr:EAL domain-containing protein [Parvibaculaceae bacterium]
MSRATNILFMLTYALSAVILTAFMSQLGYLVNGTAWLTGLLIFALCTQAHAGVNRIRERRLSKHKISELTAFANGLSRDLDTAEDCLRELNCRVEEEKISLTSSRKQEVLLLQQLAKKIASNKVAAAPIAGQAQEIQSTTIPDAHIVEEMPSISSVEEVLQLGRQAPPVPQDVMGAVVEIIEAPVEEIVDAVIVEVEEETAPLSANENAEPTPIEVTLAVPTQAEEVPQKSFAQMLQDQQDVVESEAKNLVSLEAPEEFSALLNAEQKLADTEYLRQEAATSGEGEAEDKVSQAVIREADEAEVLLTDAVDDVSDEVIITNNYTQKTTRPLTVFDQLARVTAHQQLQTAQEGPVGQLLEEVQFAADIETPASLKIEHTQVSESLPHAEMPALQEAARAPMVAPAPASADEMLLEMIRASLEEDRADLYLQPIVTLPQRRTRFYEGLTRLRGPQGQLIMPADYTRVAEPAGMMSTVDNLLLLRCVHVVRQLRERGDMTAVFCNMSAHSIMDSNFFDQFIAFMEQNADLSSQLIIELSQETLRRLGEPEQKNLMSLSMLGFRFSLDKVTSLKFDMPRLKAFGFCFIKVPAMLLLGRNDGHVNADIHPSDLGELLGRYDIELIAEHIEDEGTVRHVQDFDVSCAQGYLFGHPRPVAANVAA